MGRSGAADEASSYKPPELLAQTPPMPPAMAARKVWRLDLTTAIQLAVKQNLDIVFERRSVEASRLGVESAQGAFEPTISASYTHDDQRRPVVFATEGTPGTSIDDATDLWRLAFSKRFTTGTRIDLDHGTTRQSTTNDNAAYPRSYASTVAATVTQPLLRGFSTDLVIPRIEILRARIANERQRQQLVLAITALVERTENAYWSVLQSLFRYDLAVRSQRSAEDQMALTKRQIDNGTLPPSDLIIAESTLAGRRLDVVAAEQAIEAAMDTLRGVLDLPRERWAEPILPVDVPRFTPTTMTPDQAIAIAARARPELAQLDLDLQTSALGIRQADNHKLPQIDLGLTGRLFGQETTYVESLGGVGSLDTRGWSVFVNLTWTPMNRTSQAAADLARIQQDQVKLRQQQLARTVWLEVRDAIRSQQGAERQVKAAARFRELAEQSLDIEQRKFMNGSSQNLFVAQRQDALLQARIAELDALLAHTRAATALSRTTGQLLAERRIAID